MSRKLLVVVICGIGVLSGHALCNSSSFRGALGPLFGRGRIVALVSGNGIYEQDVRRAQEEERHAGQQSPDPLPILIADAALRAEAAHQSIPEAAIDRECKALQSQQRGLPVSARREVAARLRAEKVIEHDLIEQTKTTSEQCRQYYNAHSREFVLPIRFRASHLFVAAPPGTLDDMIDLKKQVIVLASTRIAHGETLSDLAALLSEDEATKNRGGDLGSFSEQRMPADFIEAVKKLRVGEVSGVVRTKLGFHVIQLTGSKGEHQRSFDESTAEISLALENSKRRTTVSERMAKLSAQARILVPATP
jgi:parvulin-like peptidyl-prolyl isomerase